jgi:predicted DNA-binding transcriptional regulator AlpA
MTRGRMIRLGAVCERLGCKKTWLYEKYIRPGRLKVYPLGARSRGCLEADVDRLVAKMTSAGPIDYSLPLHARAVRKPDGPAEPNRAKVAARALKPKLFEPKFYDLEDAWWNTDPKVRGSFLFDAWRCAGGNIDEILDAIERLKSRQA